MRMRYTAAVLAATLVSVGATTSKTPTTTLRSSHIGEPTSLVGSVVDAVGDAVQLAHVRVTDQASGVTSTTLTAFNGRFVVQNLTSGHQYSIQVRCIGFLPQTLDNITATTDGSAAVEVMLTPISSHQMAVAR